MYTKEDIIDLQNDIEYWKNKYNNLYQELIIMSNKIDKAVEYINRNLKSSISVDAGMRLEKVKNILQGDDKE